MKIVWTPKAKIGFNAVLDYLSVTWSNKEVENFIFKTENVVRAISANPYIFRESYKRKNVHVGLLTKHNSVFYLIKKRKQEIVILMVWDNRQNPESAKY